MEFPQCYTGIAPRWASSGVVAVHDIAEEGEITPLVQLPSTILLLQHSTVHPLPRSK